MTTPADHIRALARRVKGIAEEAEGARDHLDFDPEWHVELRAIAEELGSIALHHPHDVLPVAETLISQLKEITEALGAEVAGVEEARHQNRRLVSDHEGWARICRHYLKQGKDPREGLQIILDLCNFPETVLDEFGVKRGAWAPGLVREVIKEIKEWEENEFIFGASDPGGPIAKLRDAIGEGGGETMTEKPNGVDVVGSGRGVPPSYIRLDKDGRVLSKCPDCDLDFDLGVANPLVHRVGLVQEVISAMEGSLRCDGTAPSAARVAVVRAWVAKLREAIGEEPERSDQAGGEEWEG
jgi:hypothetical protein